MNALTQFLIACLPGALACAKVTIQGQASRRYIRNVSDSLWFNTLLFASIAILFAVFFPMCPMDPTIIAMGVALGVFTSVAQACYAVAFNAGPVSLTVLIANFSILITVLISAVAFQERIYLTQVVGIAFLLCSMFLSNDPKPGEKKASHRWLLLSLMVMLFFGLGNSTQKLFFLTESSKQPGSDISLMVAMYISASAVSCLTHLVVGRKKGRSELGFKPGMVGLAVATGAALTIYQKAYMYGMSFIDGTFYFPTVTGVQSLMITVVGVLLFRDKLSKRQRWGVVCGILCLALMNLKLG